MHDLHVHASVNDGVNLLFREGFIFAKFRENKTLAKISEFTVHVSLSSGPVLRHLNESSITTTEINL